MEAGRVVGTLLGVIVPTPLLLFHDRKLGTIEKHNAERKKNVGEGGPSE
jgi:hypothetical protein